jgi:hypothetical protein
LEFPLGRIEMIQIGPAQTEIQESRGQRERRGDEVEENKVGERW